MTDQELADAIRERFGRDGGLSISGITDLLRDNPPTESTTERIDHTHPSNERFRYGV